jgi:hypothetical protein
MILATRLILIFALVIQSTIGLARPFCGDGSTCGGAGAVTPAKASCCCCDANVGDEGGTAMPMAEGCPCSASADQNAPRLPTPADKPAILDQAPLALPAVIASLIPAPAKAGMIRALRRLAETGPSGPSIQSLLCIWLT